jgi:predicted PurR-regulated permease PerM
VGRFQQVRANLRRAYVATRAYSEARAALRTNGGPDEQRADTPAVEAAASPPVPPLPSVTSRDDEEVPRGLRMAAAWSWRLLVLAAAAAAALWLVGRLQSVLIPLAIALLLSALLSPMVSFLRRSVRLPPSLATGLVLISGLAAVAGTLTLVITQFVNGYPALSDKAASGVLQIQDWLRTGPFHLSSQQLDSALGAARKWISDNREALTSSAVSTAGATIEFLAATFLVLFATFFLLRDGNRIWRFVTNILPAAAREPVASAGEAAWVTLVAYVRATVLVAFIDAVGIGLALVILRVHFAFPLAALVFLGAFVPIVGATLSGVVAALVALVDRGPVTALLVLVAVILVQQLEGHVLQPLIMGRAVSIHPLAVIVAIATGVVLAGIVGALVAVPIVAVLNTGVRHLVSRREHGADESEPEAVVVSSRP